MCVCVCVCPCGERGGKERKCGVGGKGWRKRARVSAYAARHNYKRIINTETTYDTQILHVYHSVFNRAGFFEWDLLLTV